MTTSFTNDQGTGNVTADHFVGPLIGNVTGNISGNVTTTDLSLSGNLTVTGTSGFTGNVTANNATAGNITVTTAATMSGTLAVTGTTTHTGAVTAGNIAAGNVTAATVVPANGASGTFNLANAGNITVTSGVITKISGG